MKSSSVLLLALISLLLLDSLSANSVDLSGPDTQIGPVTLNGTFQQTIELDEALAEEGLKLPLRLIFNSGRVASGYLSGLSLPSVEKKNAAALSADPGWEIPLLHTRAGEVRPGQFTVQLLCGKTLHLTERVGLTEILVKYRHPEKTYLLEPKSCILSSNDEEWWGVAWKNGEETLLEVVRWDGWKLRFVNGLLVHLITDQGQTIVWQRSPKTQLVTSLTLNGQPLVEVAYAPESPSLVTGIKVNGRPYLLAYTPHPAGKGLVRLTQLTRPDQTTESWAYDAPLPKLPSGSASLTHTNRYGVNQTYRWDKQWGLLQADPIWDYTITAPTDLEAKGKILGATSVPAAVRRVRRATGESEQRGGTASNAEMTTTSTSGLQRKVYKFSGISPLHGKPYKIVETRNGQELTVAQYAYDEETGELIRELDVDGNQTLYTTTRHPGLPVHAPVQSRTTKHPNGVTERSEYDVRGNLIRQTNGAGEVRVMEYDAADRLVRIKNAAGELERELSYNREGRMIETKDALGQSTRYDYKGEGTLARLQQVTRPGGAKVALAYDEKGNLTKITSPNGAETRFTYNSNNLPTELTDALGQVTKLNYNDQAQVIETTAPDGTVRKTAYDDLGLVQSITDPLQQITRYLHNAQRLPKQVTDALAREFKLDYTADSTRQSLTFADKSKISYLYDRKGDLKTVTYRDGSTVNYTRNKVGDVITKKLAVPKGSQDSYTYQYDQAGRLTAATAVHPEGTFKQSWAYECCGLLSQTTLGERTARFTYDRRKQIESVTYPAGFTLAYRYDAENRVTQILKDQKVLASYGYDSSGRLIERKLASGVKTSYTYDMLDRLTSQTVSSPAGVTLWGAAYGYNAAGNRTYTQYQTGLGDAYAYDLTGQLTGVKYGAQAVKSGYAQATTAQQTEASTYDAVGNRVSFADSRKPTTVSYSANALNQYSAISGQPISYNKRGEVSEWDGLKLRYDAEGRLIQSLNPQQKTLNYLYDSQGQRVGKKSETTTEWFLPWNDHPLEAYDEKTKTATSYLWEPGVDRPLGTVTTSGEILFSHQDVLGNVVALTNNLGAPVQFYTYTAWGAVTSSDIQGKALPTSEIISRFLFTGREFDAETGLYHYRARAYSPSLGRFLQIDPIDLRANDFNTYRYVGNKAVNATDPYGLRYVRVTCVEVNRFCDRNKKEQCDYDCICPPGYSLSLGDSSRQRWPCSSPVPSVTCTENGFKWQNADLGTLSALAATLGISLLSLLTLIALG